MSGVPLSFIARWKRSSARTILSVAMILGGLLLLGGLHPAISGATPPTPSPAMVDLGTASTYGALSGASVGNTVSAPGAPFTTVRGDLGVEANTQPTGFPPGVVTGTINVGNAAATQAHGDVVNAYGNVAALTGGTPLAGALAGATVTPGLYTIAGAVSNTTTVTLNAQGDPNAVFIFQVNGAMAMAAGSHVVLAGGAQASRVFWQVNGAGAIGANASFAGTLMALNAVAVGNGSVVNGRAFALNGALTMDDDGFYSAPPVVTITGGPTAQSTDTTPTISGTTNVEAPGVVTVTVNGQTLTAHPSAGAWSVTSALLSNATYPVDASTVDGAGNTGSATQQLTIDTVPPALTITGGASATTNDPTPTIAGTTDAATGTVVNISVGSQALTALVQSGGRWNVAPTSLPDGTQTVTASVSDLAGNVTTASQALTIDTTAPAVAIDGGANALTDSATPLISGTAAVTAGTTVTVTLADQTLTGLVQNGGTWSVTPSTLSNGPHRVAMSVSDEAGNQASATQTLTVDTVPPIVSITGGAAATTSNLDPTIAGTSNAAPGTTVTVTIAGQTLTALVQSNGSWNTTPSPVGVGTWQVNATAPDPAGNVGSASQALTIALNPPPAGPAGAAGAAGAAGGTGGTGAAGGAGTTGKSTTGSTGSTGATGQTGASKPKTTSVATPRVAVSLSRTFRAAHGKGVRLAFRLSTAGKVTFTVRSGKRIVAVLKITLRKAGRSSVVWNGKIKRNFAPRGIYKIAVHGVSSAGATTNAAATMRIV